LAEEDSEQFALHTPAKLGGLLLAAVEIAAGFLREGDQAVPGVLFVNGGDRRHGSRGRFHARRALKRSWRRRVNSGGGSPPGSRAKCMALNFSGAIASASVVPSTHTGRMKTAPSAMPRVRSTA